MSELSISERVLDAVADLLRGIRVEDGYRTSVGQTVRLARRVTDPTETPCVVLWDDGESTSSGDGRSDPVISLRLLVEAHAPADHDDTGRIVQMLKADLKKALFGTRGALADIDGAKVGSFSLGAIRTSAREDGGATEWVALEAMVTYREKFGNPYAHA